MAIANLHKIDKLSVGGSFVFNEMQNVTLSAGMESLIRNPAGHPAPLFRCGLRQRPRLTFTTSELDTVLSNIGQYGLAVTGDSDFYEKLATATGNDARANSTHKRYRISDCFIYWTRITLPHNGVGTADVTLVPVYDGSNNPIVPAGSTALTSTLAATNHFGVGPVSYNGTTINGVQSLEIVNNLQLLEEGGESEIWDTFVGCASIQPIATVTHRDAISLTALGLQGTTLNGSTGFTAFARHMTGTGRSANGSSAHIKFLGANGTVIPNDISGQGTDPTMHTSRFELIAASDSTNPLTITTATTIS